MNKRTTHRQALLELMKDHRWHHHREMEKVAGWRFGARLWELVRYEGWQYEKERIGDDEWRYRLIEREPKQLAMEGAMA